MSEEDYTQFLHNKIDEDFRNGIIHFHSFEAPRKFKSVRRAMRRGLISPYGELYPKKPFNNRGGNRKMNNFKKSIYELLKQRENF